MSRISLVFLGLLLACAPIAPADDLKEEMAVVEKVRKLKFERPVTRKTMARKDLRKFLTAQLQKELPIPLDDYLQVLDALQLIDKQPGTLDSFLGLYDAQVLAFYDPATHTYYSLSDPPKGVALNEITSAALAVHELTHALQDQRFNAGERILAMKGNTEAQMAYQSVLEGEAMLVMMASLFDQLGQPLDTFIENDEMMSMMESMTDMNAGMPDEAPRYFVESMKFPYLQGLRFVAQAYRRGGWDAINALHENPPSSTEQILHPEAYFAGRAEARPETVKTANRKTLLKERMGEFTWRYLLGSNVGEGWGGDAVEVVSNGGKSLEVFVETTWDTEADAQEFAGAYREFLQSRAIKPAITAKGRNVSVSYVAP